jgi:hypothetical protein
MSSKGLKQVFIVGCVLGLVAWLAGAPLVERLVESAYSGTSLTYVNKLVAKDRLKDLQNRTLDYYQERGVGTLGRLILLYK